MVCRIIQFYRHSYEKVNVIIYVAGYPKSGTTWITRLLGDVLDCRTGGCLPEQDSVEIATEGFDRSRTDVVVRKGHFTLLDDKSSIPVMKLHQMCWKALDPAEHKVVFVIRDPRDIAVSGAFHWRITASNFLLNMISGEGGISRIGTWHGYIRSWLDRANKFNAITVKYEDMLKGAKELKALVKKLEFNVSAKDIYAAYERQQFENRVKDIERNGHNYPLGKEFNLSFMRSGVSGDWRNYLTPQDAYLCEEYFGNLLRYLNYESDPFWHKKHQLSDLKWRELQWRHLL